MYKLGGATSALCLVASLAAAQTKPDETTFKLNRVYFENRSFSSSGLR